MGDRELAGTVLKAFLQDGPAQLEQLRARFDAGDAPGARLQAHTLKGAAATVGAQALLAIAAAMEKAAVEGDLDLCRGLLLNASEEFARFKNIVERDGWIATEIDNLRMKEAGGVRA